MAKLVYKCEECGSEFDSMSAALECEKECEGELNVELSITDKRQSILASLAADCCDLAVKCNENCDQDDCPFAGNEEVFVQYMVDHPDCSLSKTFRDVSDAIQGYKNVSTILK